METSVVRPPSTGRPLPGSVRPRPGAAGKEMPSTKPNKTIPSLFIFLSPSGRKDLSEHAEHYVDSILPEEMLLDLREGVGETLMKAICLLARILEK